MKEYPSILHWRDAPAGRKCIAFNKYDGSNLRWEWSQKKRWNKYGTRNTLFDQSGSPWNQAIGIFIETMGEDIMKEVSKEFKRYSINQRRVTAFTEFFGPSSFAGNHNEKEPKQLKLFDVYIDGIGFVAPLQFAHMFNSYNWAAEVIYNGNMNAEFISDVKLGKYNVGEGVVCKGVGWMAKVKTDAWINRLKNHYGQEWEKYE